MYQITAEYSNDRKEIFTTPDYYVVGEAIWSPKIKESGVVTKVADQKLLVGDVAPDCWREGLYDTSFPSFSSWRDKVIREYLTPKDHKFLKGMNVRWE